jgi:hypothetical protein
MNETFEELPLDPEEAFLALESRFRAELGASSKGNSTIAYQNYMTQVTAALQELGIDSDISEYLPSYAGIDFTSTQNFLARVNHLRTRLEIRRSRRVQGFSVRFDPATKEKIRHHLRQVREIVGKLEIS